MHTIEVRRDDLARTRAVTEKDPRPADGQAVLRVERFSLSANNVTYAHLGDLPDVAGWTPAGAPAARLHSASPALR
jgi:hypothetical protein